MALLEAGVGVALLPRSTKAPDTLLRLMVDKLELNRTVYLYGVAGRQRTAVASTLMKMLRACDWSRYAVPAALTTMTPKPVTIAVDETRRVSGSAATPARRTRLLRARPRRRRRHDPSLHDRDRRWAHGARHRDASLSVPLYGAGRQAPRCAEACASHGARRGGGSGEAHAQACAHRRRQILRRPHDLASASRSSARACARSRFPRISAARGWPSLGGARGTSLRGARSPCCSCKGPAMRSPTSR